MYVAHLIRNYGTPEQYTQHGTFTTVYGKYKSLYTFYRYLFRKYAVPGNYYEIETPSETRFIVHYATDNTITRLPEDTDK